MIDLDNYRNSDGTINLLHAYTYFAGGEWNAAAADYLLKIESIHPITSRQAAAIAIAAALEIK